MMGIDQTECYWLFKEKYGVKESFWLIFLKMNTPKFSSNILLQLHIFSFQSKFHAGSWQKFIALYKDLLKRVQIRYGNERPKAPFDFQEVSEFMDVKKRE